MDWIIELALMAVKSLFKNPTKATAVKKVLLEIRDDISALYPGE